MVKLTPYELGVIAGKTAFETHETQPTPDFGTTAEVIEWQKGHAQGYHAAEKETQHA